jgi:hypothetical protein
MIGHGAVGAAALLSTAAVGYFVCVKANSEKKGSLLRSIGVILGTAIIVLSLLGTACLIKKAGYCPIKGGMPGSGQFCPTK